MKAVDVWGVFWVQVMAMLDELAEGGRYQEALTLLRSLEEKGIPPSAQYYHKVRALSQSHTQDTWEQKDHERRTTPA